MIYFKNKWPIYTRANCGNRGHRQIQVCTGHDLGNLGPFKFVSFVGVALDADIYFAHVYRTNHGTLAAIMPIAQPPRRAEATMGGYLHS